jgi:DnaJ-class molecular chaperone
MEFKEYYKVLGVPRDADAKAISQAFRKLARQMHPDVSKDPRAADKFKEINEAFQVLSDPENRRQYDEMLAMRESGVPWESLLTRGRPGAGGDSEWKAVFRAGGGAPFEGLGDFSEFFRSLFGDDVGERSAPFGGEGAEHPRTGTGPAGTAAGAPSTVVEITLNEAFHGTHRDLRLGTDGKTHDVKVKIPAGIKTGQKVRVRGTGGFPDLYVEVQVLSHPVFTRQGDDLRCEVPVSLAEAVLGDVIEVPTLSGKAKMTVPPETQNGQVFRLRGQGMPRLRGEGSGDLLVQVTVILPQKLTGEEKKLFEHLAKLRTERPRASLGLR